MDANLCFVEETFNLLTGPGLPAKPDKRIRTQGFPRCGFWTRCGRHNEKRLAAEFSRANSLHRRHRRCGNGDIDFTASYQAGKFARKAGANTNIETRMFFAQGGEGGRQQVCKCGWNHADADGADQAILGAKRRDVVQKIDHSSGVFDQCVTGAGQCRRAFGPIDETDIPSPAVRSRICRRYSPATKPSGET